MSITRAFKFQSERAILVQGFVLLDQPAWFNNIRELWHTKILSVLTNLNERALSQLDFNQVHATVVVSAWAQRVVLDNAERYC